MKRVLKHYHKWYTNEIWKNMNFGSQKNISFDVWCKVIEKIFNQLKIKIINVRNSVFERTNEKT